MTAIPNEILQAVRSDEDAAFDDLLDNDECCFAVDWKEEDDAIISYCEEVLRTGRLSAEWSEQSFFIVFGMKRIEVPLTRAGSEDRHITLLSLNEALSPEFEVRMLYASVGMDTGVFVPLRCDAWTALEKDAPEVVTRRFHVLASHPNTFTEVVDVPRKPGARPWWRFWSLGL